MAMDGRLARRNVKTPGRLLQAVVLSSVLYLDHHHRSRSGFRDTIGLAQPKTLPPWSSEILGVVSSLQRRLQLCKLRV